MGLSIDRFWRSGSKRKLPKPVISVGNLTLGGTGKTPLLIRLIHDLESMGLRPAILTRGYGGSCGGDSMGPESDEVSLMREKCPGVPIGVGANRFQSAERIMRESPIDIFILDDGFQHWPLARQLDIVCVDASDPWGGGSMVPAGRLREPLSALSRANIVVLTRSELVSSESLATISSIVQEKMPSGVLFISRFVSKDLPETLRNKKVLAISALGNPEEIPQSVAQQINAKHQNEQRDTGHHYDPWAEEHVVFAFRDHQSPRWERRRNAKAQEGQSGLQQNRKRHFQRGDND